MATIQFISGTMGTSLYYWQPNYWRCEVPGEALKAKGYNVIYTPRIIEPVDNHGTSISEPPDVMVLSNVYDDPDDPDVKKVKDNKSLFKTHSETISKYKELFNTRIVYQFDDNLFSLFKDSSLSRLGEINNNQRQEIFKFLDIADVIVGTKDNYKDLLISQEIKYNKFVGQWSNKYHTLPNCLPDRLNKIIVRNKDLKLKDGKLVNNKFIMIIRVLKGAIEFKQHYHEDLIALVQDNTILQLGEHSTLLNINDLVNSAGFDVEIHAYFGFLQSASANGGYVGIIRVLPPEHNVFNVYKSNIKVLEAGIAGMGLLIDSNDSPLVYEIDKLKGVKDIKIGDNTYYWIPPNTTSDMVDKFRIAKHIDKYIKAYTGGA